MKSKAATEMMLTVLLLSILIGEGVLVWASSLTSNVALVEPSIEVVFRRGQENSGPEKYDSWFGDSDGTILYFGESNWWTALDEHGNSLGNLYEAGDYIIGRFNTSSETFLPGLNVGSGGENVWDVLAHSNGRIYWTTFCEKIGYVTANGSTVKYFEGPEVGNAFNELWEGPNGTVYITRYGRPNKQDGSIVKFTPDGDYIEEFIVHDHTLPNYQTAPKSLTVDPNTGEIWLNSDQYNKTDPYGLPWKYHSFRLAPNGTLLEVITDQTEQGGYIMFLSFDDAGRGWFADLIGGIWQMRITWPDGTEQRILMESSPGGFDFVQDIKHTRDTTIAISWGGELYRFDLQPDGTFNLAKTRVEFIRTTEHLGYTAVLADNGNIYITAAERFDPPDDDIVIVKIPGPPLIYDVAIINVTLPKTMAGSGSSVKINVTVENRGNFQETFNVTAYYQNATYTGTIGTQTGITLAPGAKTTLTFIWDTTGVKRDRIPGYTIFANATVVSGETETGDNTYTDGTVKVVIPGNFNADNQVNVLDIGKLGVHWLAEVGDPRYNANVDINGDGKINVIELGILGLWWLEYE